MRITDCHAHIFPDKIAEKASVGIGDFYDTKMRYVGSCERLLESGSKAGMTNYWVHSVATTAAQIRSINSFIAQQCELHPEFIGFGSVHPDAPDMQAEIDNIIELGLYGVKLHPDFQKFNIDDPCAYPIYECIQGKLPLIIHTGDDRYDFSHPRRMAKVLEMFPKLDCICAHMGGYAVWDEAYECLHDHRCWVDSSSTMGMMNDYDHVRELVSKWGTERMLFGSDFPMWDHTEELERFEKLGITGSALDDVMYRNADHIIEHCSVGGKRA